MENQQPGIEYPMANEEFNIEKISSLFKKTLSGYYPQGHMSRIFHPKMHGLLRAEFIVNEDLDPKYKTTLLHPGYQYPAWIRLSNAKKHAAHDKKKDMRGMAIKLMEVPGTKILNVQKEAKTHDFVLVTSKTLQTRSVKDFYKSLSALMGSPLKLIWYALTHINVVRRSIKQISKCSNLLETSFYSTTPYRLGNGSLAVKYAVIPQKNHNTPFPEKPGYYFLRERLSKDLSENDFYFDFMIQLQEDANKMPIEDPTVEWKSEYIKVATIKIPKQNFDFPAQIRFGENLSFTPWHALPEHRPLGGVNRARRKVYEDLSAFRHKHNGVAENEPTYPFTSSNPSSVN